MKFFKVKNLILIYTKTHQIAPFLKFLYITPLAKRMSLRDMQISKSQKKNSWPLPLPNPGDAPEMHHKMSKKKSFTKDIMILSLYI